MKQFVAFILLIGSNGSVVASPQAVTCTGNEYVLNLTLKSSGEMINANITHHSNSFFDGDLKIYQQSMGSDASGNKFEVNKYWDPKSDKVRLSIKEFDLTSISMIKPEVVKSFECHSP